MCVYVGESRRRGYIDLLWPSAVTIVEQKVWLFPLPAGEVRETGALGARWASRKIFL